MLFWFLRLRICFRLFRGELKLGVIDAIRADNRFMKITLVKEFSL